MSNNGHLWILDKRIELHRQQCYVNGNQHTKLKPCPPHDPNNSKLIFMSMYFLILVNNDDYDDDVDVGARPKYQPYFQADMIDIQWLMLRMQLNQDFLIETRTKRKM